MRAIDQSASHPEVLVDTVGPRRRVRVTRESWSTSRALGTGPGRLGQLVDPAGPRTRVPVARESWWTTRDLGQ